MHDASRQAYYGTLLKKVNPAPLLYSKLWVKSGAGSTPLEICRSSQEQSSCEDETHK